MKQLRRFSRWLTCGQDGGVELPAIIVTLVMILAILPVLNIIANSASDISPLQAARVLAAADGRLDYDLIIGGSLGLGGDLDLNGHDIGDVDSITSNSINAPTGRSATLTVAAKTATATEQAQADLLCDGVADDEQIEAAIGALTTGEIRLTSGSFTIATPITLKTGVTLRGAGKGSTSFVASASMVASHGVVEAIGTYAAPVYFCSVQDLTISGGNQSATTGLYLKWVHYASFENLRVWACANGNGMYILDCWNNRFDNIGVDGCGNAAGTKSAVCFDANADVAGVANSNMNLATGLMINDFYYRGLELKADGVGGACSGNKFIGCDVEEGPNIHATDYNIWTAGKGNKFTTLGLGSHTRTAVEGTQMSALVYVSSAAVWETFDGVAIDESNADYIFDVVGDCTYINRLGCFVARNLSPGYAGVCNGINLQAGADYCRLTNIDLGNPLGNLTGFGIKIASDYNTLDGYTVYGCVGNSLEFVAGGDNNEVGKVTVPATKPIVDAGINNTCMIGGVANTGVVAKEYGDRRNHVTVLTVLQVDALTFADDASIADGYLLYTFPAGAIVIDYAYMSMAILSGAAEQRTDTPDIGLGTVEAFGAVSVLSGTATFENIITGQTANDCNGTAEVITLLPTAGVPFIIQAGDAHTIYFNVADAWANIAGVDLSADIGGTVTIAWRFLA